MPELQQVPAAGRWTVPTSLRELDVWVLWNGEEKTPMAPWVTGDMYRAGWGDGVVADPDSRMTERPETDYETARQFAEIPPRALHESHPFPRTDDGPDLPDRVLPTVILPHDPPDPPLMLVDFDDVRDPETGEITDEARGLLDRLDAFGEVSTSGTGVHAFVRAALPGHLGKFIAPLDDAGAIELYDHGRFVGCTWDHIEDTPMDVPAAQAVITDIVETYETPEQEQRRTRERETRDFDPRKARAGSGGDMSPYFDIDIRAVADRGDFARYRDRGPGGEWDGPHPGHGPVHSDPGECTNFGIEPRENAWHCFAHDSGGGPLHLIAVLEGHLSCAEAAYLYDRPEVLVEACLAARDTYAIGLEDAKPPYKVLVALADEHDLLKADENRLGKDCWRIAREIYDRMVIGP